RYSVLAETIYRTRNSLKQEFIYNGKLKSYAWQTLWKAASSLNSSALSSKVIYIGVHVRRTDYLKYLKKKIGTTNVVTKDYYVHAMKYILRRTNKNGNSKVVFAVTSDDMEWTRKTLIPELETNLQLMGLSSCNATVSWCGSEDYRNDLALLSFCNHSIISYGTYGAWSALMAGGNTVVFKLDPSGKRSISAQRFGRLFANWKIMT
ncbi:L-Fucosyltransferase, partial [Gryllus bimaculatus]